MDAYTFLLVLHSILRWLVLIFLVLAIYRAFNGLLTNRPFTAQDNKLRAATLGIVHLQFLAALILYFVSPVIQSFMNNFQESVKISEIRFFGMEHSLMMLVAIILITIGAISAKRKKTDRKKFKAMAIWFSIGLLIILINIPWPFSPFAERPWFRWF
ncbi:MAG: hypothetical protein WD077_13210 [Bacteroidia bacterium]